MSSHSGNRPLEGLRSSSSKFLQATGSHLFDGPTWMSRLAGQMPHEAPRAQETQMKKVLGLGSLTMMSTAAIIGSGIFVLTGVAAKSYAGPAVVISYLLGGVVAMLSAMCYMEFAAETRTTGASIIYTSKVFGKFVGWLVAINVLMELIIASAAVATGFSGYLGSLIKTLDSVTATQRLAKWDGSFLLSSPGANGAVLSIDLMAFGAVLVVMLLLVFGLKEAEWLQNTCTGLCLVAIVMCIVVGFVYTKPSNWAPFTPFGFTGVFRGAAAVFFAFLMMCAAPEEAVNARRDVPLAIGISVGGCTILYVLMALVVTGIVPSSTINASAPFSEAFKARGVSWMAIVIGFGGLAGILDTIVVTQYSMSRTFVMLGRMGLVPPMLSRVHPKTQTPIVSVLFCGILSALLALFVPIAQLADLTSMGALFAFCVVCASVLFRRYYQPPSVPKTALGMTGRPGAALWHVMIPFLCIVGSSLGLGFGYATETHWGLWVAMGALWFIATLYMWLALPVVFVPAKLPTPLFPFWPSAGILSTIFLISSLGPTNWARWGYGCLIGVGLYFIYGLVEAVYNRVHGPPPPQSPRRHDDEDEGADAGGKDVEGAK